MSTVKQQKDEICQKLQIINEELRHLLHLRDEKSVSRFSYLQIQHHQLLNELNAIFRREDTE